MPRKPVVTALNATSLDIVNTIRANASFTYQSNVPEIETEKDLPRVGESFEGYPALANEFINALVNRIALVKIQSATFNNPYKRLKKGYLEYGETVEDIFVEIARVRDFSAEKAKSRQFQRTLPDVKSVFHAMNWQVQYPMTIQNYDLKQAFLSFDGVRELIDKIIAQVYTAMEYDEFLLTKYLIIKAYNKNAIGKIPIDISVTDDNAAIAFRGTSNQLEFMHREYNTAQVLTTTPKERQLIFMDADYNAQFDVKVLASAFNMEKAEFMGSLYKIDSFTTFDNKRWAEIRAANNSVEEVTAAELAAMEDVKAIIFDENWFQLYDNLMQMTDDFVGSGLYWNYWLHSWKTIAFSPFANAVAFVTDTVSAPATIDITCDSYSYSEDINSLVYNYVCDSPIRFGQITEITGGETGYLARIAVHPYGSVMIDTEYFATDAEGTINASLVINGVTYNYTATTPEGFFDPDTLGGNDTITLTLVE